MIRWCLNISILLREYPFLDRFQAAADLGFGAVEFWWPTGVDLDALIRACKAAGLAVALFNTDAGDLAAGERGFLGNPARADYILSNFQQALELADALGCKQIHVPGGDVLPGMSEAAMAAESIRVHRQLCALALPRRVTLTLEPQNVLDAPYFRFRTVGGALAYIDQVGAENLKIQYDVYHQQRTEGNIVANLRAHLARIAHIQIADVPDRNQPGTGELRYSYIFEQLVRMGYAGYVSLEYIAPGGDTRAALEWLPLECRKTFDPATHTLRIG